MTNNVISMKIRVPDDGPDEDAPREPRKPAKIDAQIGAVLRLHRLAGNLSQEEVGRRMGLTFQQIQKYEKGTNRISLSALLRLCKAMGTDPLHFVSAVTDLSDVPVEYTSIKDEAANLMGVRGSLDLMRAYADMLPEDRKMIRNMARRLASGVYDDETE
jgi:transcriptional regulator with XRE-family HTH domain